MAGAEDVKPKPGLVRCMDWLQKQNELEPKKLSLQNKNDIQFIIETNAHRKKFLLSVAEDDASVPAGVGEPNIEPKDVPLRYLRIHNLRMLCEWHECQCYYTDYKLFQKHVSNHMSVNIDETDKTVNYMCLWDICGFSTLDYFEMFRHINYHAYHAKLLAIGFNARATLKLERCKKDSSARNKLPLLKTKHTCLWTGCTDTYNSMQLLLDHVKVHVFYAEENLCSWAGCGATYPRRDLLSIHLRSHTGERLLACYHCGRHFSCNRKLTEHLARQNVHPSTGHTCSVCGACLATQYLLREHLRQHVSAHACTLCDMSAPSPNALAQHVRYRHAGDGARAHPCPSCSYRAISRWDLKQHIATHTRKKKKKNTKDDSSDIGPSDEENSDGELKRKKKVARKYACHLCPEKQMKVFCRGARLTTHLVKVHGAQWPFGYSRFRYQISDDGMYRLMTTRFEYEEVSQKIVDGYSGPKVSFDNNKLKFHLKLVAEPTENTPIRFEVVLENKEELKNEIEEQKEKDNAVEITMCDVDEDGNIISSKTIKSDVVFR